MNFDPNISLEDRLELGRLPEKSARQEQARAVRIHVRQELADQTHEAQNRICEAEEEARRRLPTPLTDDAIKIIDGHPAVFGRRQELLRLLEEFAPIALEQAEAIARAIEDDEDGEATPLPIKTGRKPKSTGSVGAG